VRKHVILHTPVIKFNKQRKSREQITRCCR